MPKCSACKSCNAASFPLPLGFDRVAFCAGTIGPPAARPTLPKPGSSWAADHAQKRADRELAADLELWVGLFV